ATWTRRAAGNLNGETARVPVISGGKDWAYSEQCLASSKRTRGKGLCAQEWASIRNRLRLTSYRWTRPFTRLTRPVWEEVCRRACSGYAAPRIPRYDMAK